MNTSNAPLSQTQNPSIILDNAERQVCEVWTRVMGYHRPVSSFNTGKKGEFYERTYFEENTVEKAY
nr:anaerobic ribonucleoside-triphosphate reductase [uncultured Undibacterium sp.]